MAKIALIGAGSSVFTKQLLNDLFQVEALAGSSYVLMAPTLHKLQKMKAFCNKLIENNGIRADVSITTDRQEALHGADYVIVTIRVGSDVESTDKAIPLKYGINQAIGDTMGPGGVMRAQRTIPVLLDIARDMERLCPNAIMLNYTNPMSTVCLAIGKHSRIRSIGLCHGVQTTLGLIARFTDVPKNEIEYECSGINHMSWFLKLQHNGEDLYPLLKERAEKPEYFLSDKVRCEVMRHFGYFMTESTEHLSEYLPWFRKNEQQMKQFLDTSSFGRTAPIITDEKGKQLLQSPIDYLELEEPVLQPRSDEYCSHIIEALETGRPFQFIGNVINNGYIDNLPANSCVEVPVVASHDGLQPTHIGSLPTSLAALNMTNILVHQLSVEAAIEGDTEKLFSAMALDPLTSAVLSLQETRDMASELLEAQIHLLPQYKGKKMVTTRTITIPENTVPVETPIDPALAIAYKIANRFQPQ